MYVERAVLHRRQKERSMSHILTIAGSPSSTAKSSAILDFAHRLAKRQHAHTHVIRVRDLPAEDLLHANLNSVAIQSANMLVDQAEGIIIATPVYKAAYAGILKAFLDLLPQDALCGKTILPLATGGSPAHLLAVEYALNPVLSALGAAHILRGVYATDSQIQFAHGGELQLEEAISQHLQESVCELIAAVQRPFPARAVA